MSQTFALAAFLARSTHAVRHDLAASDSETLSLAALLRLADPDDRRRYRMVGLSYAEPRGAEPLRAAIAARHERLGADDVLCCAGAQEAVTCVTRALLQADSHAVVVVPIYQPSEEAVTGSAPPPAFRSTRAAGGSTSTGWRRRCAPKRGWSSPTSPNSPTGASLHPDTLAALVGLCRRRGLWLVIDEVYRQTDSGGPGSHPPMVADLYERGVSINGLSKGFGLPGLRVGWVAAQDRQLLERALAVKSMLSSCVASTSEVLAEIALKAETRIVGQRRQIGRRNHLRLQALCRRVPGVFAPEPATNLAFAFPRYLGPEGTDRFAATLVRDAGLLVLPGGLWRSPLVRLPVDRVRIGLGHAKSGAGLEALETFLLRSARHRSKVSAAG